MQGHLEKEESKKAEKEDTQIHSGTLLYVCALEMKPCCMVTVWYAYASGPFKGFVYWNYHALYRNSYTTALHTAGYFKS